MTAFDRCFRKPRRRCVKKRETALNCWRSVLDRVRGNTLFAAVVLVIAGVLFSLRSAGQSGSTLGAELIYGDANTVQKISLDKDAVYDIDTGYLTVHIEVKDGAARFIDSPCPDHICESFGWISQEDQTATCLPARAVLTIVPLA